MKSEAADASSSSDEDAVAAVTNDVKVDDREIVRCMTDPALIAAAESITNSFLTAEPEPVKAAESSLKRKRAKQRQCGCTLGEVCHICNKCLEKHCTCGDRKRHRSLCLESRACTCLLVSPADRCALCHGCQRKQGYSHCRCIQHGQQRLQRSRATVKDRASTKGQKSDKDGMQCRCFALSADVIPPTAANGGVSERSLRIRRLRRAVGISSVESLYHRTINSSLTDDEAAAENEERDAGKVIAASEEGLQSVLHHPLIRRLMSIDTYAPPYQQLRLGDGASFLESIEPKDGNVHRHPGKSKGLVDYLVHASSIKAATVSEMIGTFDDSAAVAAAIVVEEYMKQIMGDLLAENRPVLSLTKASVQAFASHMLKGFNWILFHEQHVGITEVNKWRELVSAIYQELVAVEKLDETAVSATKQTELLDWIQETVTRHRDFLESDVDRRPAAKEEEEDEKNREKQEAAPKENILESFRRAASNVPTPHVRVGVRRNESLGLPVYNFTLKSKLGGDHLIRVSADNFETQQKALRKVDDVKQVLADQHKRIWNDMLEEMPAILQRELAAELKFPTGREIIKLPTCVQKNFARKVKGRRKMTQEEINERNVAKQRAYRLRKKAKLEALAKDPNGQAELQVERERHLAANARRRVARKAERQRRRAEKQALREQEGEPVKTKPKQMKPEVLEEIKGPAVDALYQQLSEQIRQTRENPSSKPPLSEEKPKPKAAKKTLTTKEPKPKVMEKPVAPSDPRSVRPKAPVDPSMPRRPRGRPRKAVPTEDTSALID